MPAFTYIDYGIALVIILSITISFGRGFVREALSLSSWIIAFWVAFTFHDQLALLLTPYIATPSLRIMASFSILFFITLLLGALLGFLLSRLIVSTGLSGTDRSLGMAFGLTRGVLLVGIVLLLMSMTSFTQDSWWQNSVLIPHFQPLLIWLKGFLPDKMAEISNFVTSTKTSL